MFVWRARTVLDALAEHLPETAEGLRRIVAAPRRDRRGTPCSPRSSPTLPKISVDYAVLEPAAAEPGRVLVVDLDVDWLDVGSWPALAHTLAARRRRQRRPRARPCCSTARATSSSATTPTHLVALVGVRDSVVVHTADVTMVCPVADAERVKQLLAAVERGARPRYS